MSDRIRSDTSRASICGTSFSYNRAFPAATGSNRFMSGKYSANKGLLVYTSALRP